MNGIGVVICAAALLLSACSRETEAPDRGATDAGRGEGSGSVPARQASDAASTGHAEYTVEDVLLRREAEALDIEEARLQRTQESGSREVVVRTAVRKPADYEKCLLMNEPTWRELERSFAEDDLPEKQVIAHPWGRRTLREEFVVGDRMVVVFSESAGAGGSEEVVEPLYALCYSEVTTGAGGRRTTYYDVSRVEGATEPS